MGTGVELCYELRGAPEDPVVVLIAGLGRQLIGWDDEFCDQLVARGFGVLRFDNRDAGLSTHLPGGPGLRPRRGAARRTRCGGLHARRHGRRHRRPARGARHRGRAPGRYLDGRHDRPDGRHPAPRSCAQPVLDHVDDRRRRRGPADARGHGGRHATPARGPRAPTSPSSSPTAASSGRDGRSSTRNGGGTDSSASSTAASTRPGRGARSWPSWHQVTAPPRSGA